MTKINCTLEKDINKCPHFVLDDGTCTADNPCSFAEKPGNRAPDKDEYVREERWFEKYYDK